MSTRTDAYIQASLDLIYKNTDFAGIGDAGGVRGSVAPGNLYVSLQTESGEVAYTGYARQPVVRSASGWSRTGNVVTNVASIIFPLCPTGTTEQTATKVAIFTAETGGTKLHEVSMATPIPIQAAIRPLIEAAAITITGS